MSKEKQGIGFIESLKKKKRERKLAKELLETLNFDKYDHLPISVADDLIKKGYGEEVAEHIDKFDEYDEILDKLMYAGYDITKFVLSIYNNKIYKLTHKRILDLILYRPGLICGKFLFPGTDFTTVDEMTWKRMCLIDYEYFKSNAKSPDTRNSESLNKVVEKYFGMSDIEILDEFYGNRHDENGKIIRDKDGNPIFIENTYGYNKKSKGFGESLRYSEIKALKDIQTTGHKGKGKNSITVEETKEKKTTGTKRTGRGGFISTIKDMIGSLGEISEEKRKKIEELNNRYLKTFHEGYSKDAPRGSSYDGKYERRNVSKGDRIERFDDVKELIECIEKGSLDESNHVRRRIPDGIKVGVMNGNCEQYKALFKKIYIKGGAYLDINFGVLGGYEYAPKIIDYFMKQVDIEGCRYCMFAFEYLDKKTSKRLIKRFTKLGKQGKIHNCVIRIRGKEYHSSGDYRYDNFD